MCQLFSVIWIIELHIKSINYLWFSLPFFVYSQSSIIHWTQEFIFPWNYRISTLFHLNEQFLNLFVFYFKLYDFFLLLLLKNDWKISNVIHQNIDNFLDLHTIKIHIYSYAKNTHTHRFFTPRFCKYIEWMYKWMNDIKAVVAELTKNIEIFYKNPSNSRRYCSAPVHVLNLDLK